VNKFLLNNFIGNIHKFFACEEKYLCALRQTNTFTEKNLAKKKTFRVLKTRKV